MLIISPSISSCPHPYWPSCPRPIRPASQQPARQPCRQPGSQKPASQTAASQPAASQPASQSAAGQPASQPASQPANPPVASSPSPSPSPHPYRSSLVPSSQREEACPFAQQAFMPDCYAVGSPQATREDAEPRVMFDCRIPKIKGTRPGGHRGSHPLNVAHMATGPNWSNADSQTKRDMAMWRRDTLRQG